MHSRPGRRGNYADPLWIERQCFFSLLGKQSFCFQPFLQLFIGHIQGAEAVRLHILCIDLILPASLINADSAPHQNLHTIFRHKTQPSGMLCKHYCLYYRPVILQGEIEMPGFIVIGKIRDFTHYKNLG